MFYKILLNNLEPTKSKYLDRYQLLYILNFICLTLIIFEIYCYDTNEYRSTSNDIVLRISVVR